MSIMNRKEPLFLFVGDTILFLLALWTTLVVRYIEIPGKEIFLNHLVPFSFLFIVWILVFFISGLYGKHTVLFKKKLPGVIFRAQLINIVIAALFFFFIPIFGIAPKTNLIIYLIISSVLIIFWRLLVFPRFRIRKRQRALFIGSGEAIQELKDEVNNNTRYSLLCTALIDLDNISTTKFLEEVKNTVSTKNISVIVIDSKDERVVSALPSLYTLIFKGVQFVDMGKLYEDIFDCISVSFVKQYWLLDNVSFSTKFVYDFLKRLFDIFVSIIIGGVSLPLYPFISAAIKLDDGGPIFYVQERVGEGGRIVHIAKFRTMSEKEKEVITNVGAFLRNTRIDELPQLWSVLRGDLSLIGPRPEIPRLVDLYEQEVPYYNIRHLIKPGLSGWAQIHQTNPPKFGVQYDETKLKLAYDLYYIKNRSFLIDLKIALLTIKILVSRSGV